MIQYTMETDYGLPIAMHRPFIDLSSGHDSPLPSRKSLSQVTEVNEENSMPYQLPKDHRVSRFEQLPLEIRQFIYGMCNKSLIQPTSASEYLEFPNYDCKWPCIYLGPDDGELKLMRVSRQIRAEMLGMMLRDMSVKFRYPLSDRKIYRNSFHSVYGTFPTMSLKVERMSLACSTFQFMRRLRLESTTYFSRYSVEQPHSALVSKKRRDRHVVLLADSIKFVAKHCPNLVALHIEPARSSAYDEHGVQLSVFTPVIAALKGLVEHCPSLEVVGMIGRTRKVCISTFGQQIATWDWAVKQDHDLVLGHIPVYARPEAVEQWCKSSVQEIIEYNEITEFVPWNEFACNTEVGCGPRTEIWAMPGYDAEESPDTTAFVADEPYLW
ncbi:hypothetical protein DE146DRAFT_240277 [Phaeosphaeria sp. MPI-PUGE-AT-0046c]|nr:hypothetical protein DE146DRAFT_240277 [Phaeosphaeria sp. MPI-PUGE-AT-0046c]